MAKKRNKTPKAATTAVVPTVSGRKVVTLPTTSELPNYYINNVSIDISSWDMRFRLGQIHGMDVQTQTINVKDVAIMYMSHAHARAFAVALLQSVAKLDTLPQPVFVNPNEQTH